MTKSSLALHYAHRLDKPGFAWSDIVKHAWYFVRFREALKQGVATFSYFKKDGTIREAKGTLSELLIPEDDKPKQASPKSSPEGKDLRNSPSFRKGSGVGFSVFTYYDLDRKAWRSFDLRSFIGYVEYYKLQKETR